MYLAFWRASGTYTWEPRAALRAHAHTRALLDEFECYARRKFPPGPAREPGSAANGGTDHAAAGTQRRRRFERGDHLLIADQANSADTEWWPALIREVLGDSISLHFVGFSAEHDETLLKVSKRIGAPVDASTQLHSRGGRARTLARNGSPLQMVAAGSALTAARAQQQPSAGPATALAARVPPSGARAPARSSRTPAQAAPARPGAGPGGAAAGASGGVAGAAVPPGNATTSVVRALRGSEQSTSLLGAEPPDAAAADGTAAAGAGRGARAKLPAVEMNVVDWALGDVGAADAELLRHAPARAQLGDADARVDSPLVCAAFSAARHPPRHAHTGCRVLARYGQLWYRATVLDFCAREGRAEIMYDADGCIQHVGLPSASVLLLAAAPPQPRAGGAGTSAEGTGRAERSTRHQPPARAAAAASGGDAAAAGGRAPLSAPLHLGDGVCTAEGLLCAATRLLNSGYALLRTACDTLTIRHEGQLRGLWKHEAALFQHALTEARARAYSRARARGRALCALAAGRATARPRVSARAPWRCG